MFHKPVNEAIVKRPRADRRPVRSKLIGTREIILVMLAFALLALVPSVAQIAPFGGSSSVASYGWKVK